MQRLDDQLLRQEAIACQEIAPLFDVLPGMGWPVPSAESLITCGELQRELDRAVNNCTITREAGCRRSHVSEVEWYSVCPHASGAPPPRCKIFSSYTSSTNSRTLTEAQQKYINTLIREKERPCTFKMGRSSLRHTYIIAPIAQTRTTRKARNMKRCGLTHRLRSKNGNTGRSLED